MENIEVKRTRGRPKLTEEQKQKSIEKRNEYIKKYNLEHNGEPKKRGRKKTIFTDEDKKLAQKKYIETFYIKHYNKENTHIIGRSRKYETNDVSCDINRKNALDRYYNNKETLKILSIQI